MTQTPTTDTTTDVTHSLAALAAEMIREDARFATIDTDIFVASDGNMVCLVETYHEVLIAGHDLFVTFTEAGGFALELRTAVAAQTFTHHDHDRTVVGALDTLRTWGSRLMHGEPVA